MAVSKRLRFEILRRDNHRCRYCGVSVDVVRLVVDHVVPEALGGTNEPTNLAAACEPCNSGKSSVPPDATLVDDVKQDDLRWAQAMDRARAIRRAHVQAREAYAEYFLAEWDCWRAGSGQNARPVPLDDAWRATLDKFFEYEVEPDDLKHAVNTAMTAVGVSRENTFRYFCGIVWRIVRELQEMAGHIVVADLNEEMYGERG
jgi:hypothetical protein